MEIAKTNLYIFLNIIAFWTKLTLENLLRNWKNKTENFEKPEYMKWNKLIAMKSDMAKAEELWENSLL